MMQHGVGVAGTPFECESGQLTNSIMIQDMARVITENGDATLVADDGLKTPKPAVQQVFFVCAQFEEQRYDPS